MSAAEEIANAYRRGLSDNAQELLLAIVARAEAHDDMQLAQLAYDALMDVRELGYAVERALP